MLGHAVPALVWAAAAGSVRAEPAEAIVSVRATRATVALSASGTPRLVLETQAPRRVDAGGMGALLPLFEGRVEPVPAASRPERTYEMQVTVQDLPSGDSHTFRLEGHVTGSLDGPAMEALDGLGPTVASAQIGRRFYQLTVLGPRHVRIRDTEFFHVRAILVRSWPEEYSRVSRAPAGTATAAMR
jgi:hypothetical protein